MLNDVSQRRRDLRTENPDIDFDEFNRRLDLPAIQAPPVSDQDANTPNAFVDDQRSPTDRRRELATFRDEFSTGRTNAQEFGPVDQVAQADAMVLPQEGDVRVNEQFPENVRAPNAQFPANRIAGVTTPPPSLVDPATGANLPPDSEALQGLRLGHSASDAQLQAGRLGHVDTPQVFDDDASREAFERDVRQQANIIGRGVASVVEPIQATGRFLRDTFPGVFGTDIPGAAAAEGEVGSQAEDSAGNQSIPILDRPPPQPLEEKRGGGFDTFQGGVTQPPEERDFVEVLRGSKLSHDFIAGPSKGLSLPVGADPNDPANVRLAGLTRMFGREKAVEEVAALDEAKAKLQTAGANADRIALSGGALTTMQDPEDANNNIQVFLKQTPDGQITAQQLFHLDGTPMRGAINVRTGAIIGVTRDPTMGTQDITVVTAEEILSGGGASGVDYNPAEALNLDPGGVGEAAAAAAYADMLNQGMDPERIRQIMLENQDEFQDM
jgi:hypothetical protein